MFENMMPFERIRMQVANASSCNWIGRGAERAKLLRQQHGGGWVADYTIEPVGSVGLIYHRPTSSSGSPVSSSPDVGAGGGGGNGDISGPGGVGNVIIPGGASFGGPGGGLIGVDHDPFGGHSGVERCSRPSVLSGPAPDVHWKPGRPILFYTSNEGSVEHFAHNTGFMLELAENLTGAVIFAEHRYYGSSLPFGNQSFSVTFAFNINRSRFGYLTAEQALADYAKLLADFKCLNRQFSNSPVISFTGSYAYPNIVAGGLASSAPIWLFPGMADCQGFLQVTTNAYERFGGSLCTSNIREVPHWSLIDEVVKKSPIPANGLDDLSRILKTCKPFPSGDFLSDFAQYYLVTLAMANYPYSASFLGELPAWPVKEFCKAMKSCQTHGKLSPQEDKYLSFGDNSVNLDANGWELQTCMEMTNPLCSDGKSDMFKSTSWNPINFSNNCHARYGVRPRMDWAGLQWWAKDVINDTRLIFSNGDIDPWSAFGVLNENAVPGATVVLIDHGAYHLDLRGSHPNDTAEVRAARGLIRNKIAEWIDEWQRESHPLYCLDL
ncbi:hypothetical protein Aperf_G00000129790 [Anoplocephala perfoliata]